MLEPLVLLFGTGSIKQKTAYIGELIINNGIDICAITETWLRGDHRDSHVIADLNNTLPNFQFHHIHRHNRTGGGVLVCRKKSINVRLNDTGLFSSFEYIDLSLSTSLNTPLRLLVVYRPPTVIRQEIHISTLHARILHLKKCYM